MANNNIFISQVNVAVDENAVPGYRTAIDHFRRLPFPPIPRDHSTTVEVQICEVA